MTRDIESQIIGRTVTSKPGAAIHVTELELSEAAHAGLKTSATYIGQPKRSMTRLIEITAAALAVIVALAIGVGMVVRAIQEFAR